MVLKIYKSLLEKKHSLLHGCRHLLPNRLIQRDNSTFLFSITILAGHATSKCPAKRTQLHVVIQIHLSALGCLYFEFVCTTILAQFKLPEKYCTRVSGKINGKWIFGKPFKHFLSKWPEDA